MHLGRLMAGDESAFSDLYRSYWEALFRYVIRILPDEDDVADVIQETFVTFWELRGKLGNIKSIKAYLFIMARNLAFRRVVPWVLGNEMVSLIGSAFRAQSRLPHSMDISAKLSSVGSRR